MINDKSLVVSVCMITYNHEKYIAEAIENVILQKTNFSFELVIGEDCSTDKTREICNTYITKYPNLIKLILHEKKSWDDGKFCCYSKNLFWKICGSMRRR